jgi:hypothetical protein
MRNRATATNFLWLLPRFVAPILLPQLAQNDDNNKTLRTSKESVQQCSPVSAACNESAEQEKPPRTVVGNTANLLENV